MAEETEILDSLNEETDDTGNDDIAVLQEKYWKVSDTNRKLFARAKKAEGFELKDDKWVKTEKPPEPKKEPEAKIPEKPNELDYGQKAFLKTYGISGPDELTLVKSWVERTGDALDNLVDDEIFNARLKNLRDAKAAKDALPINPKRGPIISSRDKAEFWADKPFSEVPENLKKDVLNLKIKNERESDKFGGNKIIG
jgi:hypothetical protein